MPKPQHGLGKMLQYLEKSCVDCKRSLSNTCRAYLLYRETSLMFPTFSGNFLPLSLMSHKAPGTTVFLDMQQYLNKFELAEN